MPDEPELAGERPAGLPCPGCGTRFAATAGPIHPYIGASAGCWAAYGAVLAREYGEFGYPDVHRLTVDAYAAQHPGVPSRQSVQSVAVHLIGLHLVLERSCDAKAATRAIRAAVARGGFLWLTPPASLGALSVRDLLGAVDLPEHTRRVEQWAASVWTAWSPHADTVRAWAAH